MPAREPLLYYAAYVFPHLYLTVLHPITGEQIWHKKIAIEPFSGVTELHLVDDILYVGSWGSFIAAVDTKTACVLWQYQANRQNSFDDRCGIAICCDIICLMGYHTLSALQITTGQLLWTNKDEAYTFLQIKATDKAIYIVASEGRSAYSRLSPCCVLVLDLATGKVLWRKMYDDLSLARLFVAAIDRKVYVTSQASGSPFQMFQALHAESGHEIWKKEIIPGRVLSGLQIDDVFYLTVDAHLFALDARTGNQHWEYEHHPLYNYHRRDNKPDHSVSLLASKDPLFTFLVSVEERYDDYDECLYCLSAIDSVTGKVLWNVSEGGDIVTTTRRQEVIFFSTCEEPWHPRYRLIAVSKENGRALWSTFIEEQYFQAMICT